MAIDNFRRHVDGPRCAHGDPEFAERYRAIESRDIRFDGQFFTAVASTGIYCRPSCPARTPKPGNVAFYQTSAAAQEAGFRACKRCLPEATPGTPEWDLRRDLTGRAMRLIADGVVDREGVAGLAGRLGYTARHVQRLLVAELGAGPLSLARARRAQTARALLVASNLQLGDVAFAAGFGSVRQFNQTFQEVFGLPPRDVRAQASQSSQSHKTTVGASRRHLADRPTTGGGSGGKEDQAAGSELDSEATGVAPVLLSVELPVRQPFDAPGVFGFLAVRAIDGVETASLDDADQLRYARTLTLPHGPAAIEVTATRTSDAQWRLQTRLELVSLADVATAVARVRRLLDLDADPVAIDTALSADSALAPLIEHTHGIRVPGAVDPHEIVMRALVGQQISVAAHRTHLSRLATAIGVPYTSNIPGLNRLFPTARQIAEQLPEPVQGEPLDPDRPLRLPGQAIRAVLGLARALASGELEVHIGADPETLREQLVAYPRIGPWTAAYIAMRVLGDPDAWLSGDLALIAGARAVGILDPDLPKAASRRALADRAEAWAPWRSYAAMHLWQAATPANHAGRKTP